MGKRAADARDRDVCGRIASTLAPGRWRRALTLDRPSTRDGSAATQALTGWPRVDRLALAALFVVLVVVGAWVWPIGLVSDEPQHLDQIARFVRGEWTVNPTLTTVPGFHALVAAGAWLTGARSVFAIRLLTFPLSLGAVVAFYACARALTPERAAVRAWQFVLLPILTPFFFLLFTDVVALWFVLLALRETLSRRFGRAAGFAAAGVLIRQNHILWVGFFLVLWVMSAWRSRPDREADTDVTRWAAPAVIHGLVFAAFAAFVMWNGGIALHEQEAHPFPAVHLHNVTFGLFLHLLFFLPMHARNVGRVGALLRGRPWIAGAIASAALALALTFSNDNPHNADLGGDYYFLRNRALAWLAGTLQGRALLCGAVLYASLSLSVTRLVDRRFVWIAPFSVLFLIPSWLVEQRYLLVPFTLFLLARRPGSAREEAIDAAWMVPFTAWFLWGITTGRFFL